MVLVQNMQLAENVEVLAKKKGCTPGQLALAWVSQTVINFHPAPAGAPRSLCSFTKPPANPYIESSSWSDDGAYCCRGQNIGCV